MIIIKKIPRIKDENDLETFREEMDAKLFSFKRKLNKRLRQLKDNGSIKEIKGFISQLSGIKAIAKKRKRRMLKSDKKDSDKSEKGKAIL